MTCQLPCTSVQDLARGYLMAVDLSECNCCELAGLLEVSGETIRRRLTREGVSWRDLKREEQARRLRKIIEDGPKFDPLEASRRCGFHSTERFFQFFKQVMGQTYTDWRLDLQEAGFCGLMSLHEEQLGARNAQ